MYLVHHGYALCGAARNASRTRRLLGSRSLPQVYCPEPTTYPHMPALCSAACSSRCAPLPCSTVSHFAACSSAAEVKPGNSEGRQKGFAPTFCAGARREASLAKLMLALKATERLAEQLKCCRPGDHVGHVVRQLRGSRPAVAACHEGLHERHMCPRAQRLRGSEHSAELGPPPLGHGDGDGLAPAASRKRATSPTRLSCSLQAPSRRSCLSFCDR